jgi:hypothetical protein
MSNTPPKAGLENILGIVGAQGYMRNLGPGARHISKATQANYLLGLKNATARYGEEGEEPNSGRARIHYAVIHNKKNLLRNLKTRGADLEMTLDGKTPLMLAVEANKPEMIEELCKLGADVNKQVENGETALHLAVLYGNFKIVNLLLDCGADPTIGAGSIMTPLHNAAFNGNEQMMALLLKRGAKKAIDAKSMRLLAQQAPIHTAIGAGCLGCVKLLVEAGADTTIKNKGGQTPFQLAEEEYEWKDEAVHADMEKPYVSASTREYHLESRKNAYDILRFLEEVTGQRSVALLGIIDGGRRRTKHRATRRRKANRAQKSRKQH